MLPVSKTMRSSEGELTWTFTSRNKREITRDFTKERLLYGPRFGELFDAARRLSLYSEGTTAIHHQYAMLTMAKALKRYPPRAESVTEWEASVLGYISRKKVSEYSKFSLFNETAVVLREVARARQESYAPERNPFSKRTKQETQYLVPATMKAIRVAAREAAKASCNRFMSPPATYVPYLSELREIAQANDASFR